MFGYQRVYGWKMLDIIVDIMCILTHAMWIHTIQSSYTGGVDGISLIINIGIYHPVI